MQLSFLKQRNMIFIPENVPSIKNSKIPMKHASILSTTAQKYLRLIGIQSYSAKRKEVKEFKTRENIFRLHTENQFKSLFDFSKGETLELGIHFVRGTRHKTDFHNLCQIIFDLLVAHNILPDDDMDTVMPIPLKIKGQWYSYDKIKPGVYLDILNPNKAPF